MKKPTRAKHSEVRAYQFILNDLNRIGWICKNPSTNSEGEVWTQNECFAESEIKKYLGLDRPENIIKLTETELYVIEAKRTISELDKAVDEAVEYANEINKSKKLTVKIISGVAGNIDDGYYIRSKFLKGTKWKDITINKNPLTSLVSKKLAKELLLGDTFEIKEIQIEEKDFISAAEDINWILHNGSIHKDYRARVLSALLLSLLESTPLNLNETPTLLIHSINARVNALLQKEGKASFANHIELTLPSTPDNHFKFKGALVKTLRKLDDLNIRAAFNAGTDVLGKFYEVFLKYGNGAKEIGIVLTPRHITRFAAEILDIKGNDLVFDPTCGTGGFLVAAFDYVKERYDKNVIDKFKEYNLFGIDQQDFIVALAIVNMIFRGDGKNNIIEGNSLKKWVTYHKTDTNVISAKYLNEPLDHTKTKIVPVISKVLMNPPFAQEEKEFDFISHTLKQMRDEGLLFCVLPKGVMVKQGKNLAWRTELLKHHTLISILNFPDDLFYPTGTQTCAIILRKGVPHVKSQNVFWINIKEDGLLKSKGKRLPSTRTKNQLEIIKPLLISFIKDPNTRIKNIPLFQKACPVDFTDKNLELLPEVYLDAPIPSAADLLTNIETTLREFISIMVRNDNIKHFENLIKTQGINLHNKYISAPPPPPAKMKEVNIKSMFKEPINTGDTHVSSILDEGTIPLISCAAEGGGVEGFFDVQNTCSNAITIACDGAPLTSFYHYYPFFAKDNVIIGHPKKEYLFTTNLFIVNQINGLRWRFSYGRKCYLNKLHKIDIFMPLNGTEINEDYISYLFHKSPSWNTLTKLFK